MIQFSRIQLKDWETVLVDKYPLIFSEGAKEYKQYAPTEDPSNLINLRYGFECGSGWRELIEEIATVGTALVTKLRETGHPDSFIHSCIVKEKFGTLRWQGDFNLPENFSKLWMGYVASVESRSAYMCEVTGGYGRIRNKKNGKLTWIKTLCDAEAKKQGYDIEIGEL